MKNKEPLVYIIILNYNGLADTIACLDSLLKISYLNKKILVIDNDSKKNEVAELSARYGIKINIIANSENLGFSGGNNVGFQLALKNQADYVLLLNNDTVCSEMFLSRMINKAESDKRIGITGCLINYYQSDLIYAVGGGRSNFLTDNFSLYGAFKKVYNKKIIDIGYINGCCLLIKQEVLKKIGFFDDRFFLYNEETDLCLRAKADNFKLAISYDAQIWHKSAQSTQYLSETYVYYMIRNKLLLAKKHLSKLNFKLFFIIFFIKECIGYTCLGIYKKQYKTYKIILVALQDYFKNKFGKKK